VYLFTVITYRTASANQYKDYALPISMYIMYVCVLAMCNIIMFPVNNGVKHDGILSPHLFRFYIGDIICKVTNSFIGCTMHNRRFNLLAYEDDLVLLSPSWRRLQYLIDLLVPATDDISLSVTAKKTVTMVFSPTDKSKCFCSIFPPFLANGNNHFVTCFKYLEHTIEHTLSDDSDINLELKCSFVGINLLNGHFWRCSFEFKLRLFKTFCMCFYDIRLRRFYRVGSLRKPASTYVKRIKTIFPYHKYCSVSRMLMDLGLPCLNTVTSNANFICDTRLKSFLNSLVQTAILV